MGGILGTLVGFFGLGWLLLWTLDATGQKYAKVELDQVVGMEQMLRTQADYDGPPRIVYLGDSLSMQTRGRSTPGELRRMLRLRGGPIGPESILNVSAPGLTAFSHYFMSEQLTALNADRFIVSVNLGWFSRGTLAQQPNLSALLPPTRWPEAAQLPLHEVGLSADEVVLAHAIASLGYLPWWQSLQREQVRFRNAVNRLARMFQVAVGHPGGASFAGELRHYRATSRARANRPTRIGAIRRWGPVLAGLEADDANLRVLDALLRRLRRTDAPVLVMVAPTNVEALDAIGMYDHDGFATSLARIREVAERNGADFLDLHHLLPDAAFRDPRDHLDQRSPIRPSAHLAAQMVLWSEGAEDYARFLPSPEELGRPPAR